MCVISQGDGLMVLVTTDLDMGEVLVGGILGQLEVYTVAATVSLTVQMIMVQLYGHLIIMVLLMVRLQTLVMVSIIETWVSLW